MNVSRSGLIFFAVYIVSSIADGNEYNPYGDDEVAVYKLLLSLYPNYVFCTIRPPASVKSDTVEELSTMAKNAGLRLSDSLQLYWLIQMHTSYLTEYNILELLRKIINAIYSEMQRNNLDLKPQYPEFCAIINPDGTAPLNDAYKTVQTDLQSSYNNMRNFLNQILPPLSYRLQRDIVNAVREYTTQTTPLTQALMNNISVLYSQMYEYYLLHY